MRFVLCIVALTFIAVPAFAQHQHEGDIIVGITGPTAGTADTLAFEGDFDEAVFLSPVSGLLNGWTSAEPGFEHLEEDEDDENFYKLASGVNVRLVIVSIDPGLAVVEAGGGTVADAIGESILLGGFELHSHATWYAQSSVLGAGWTGTLGATFKLIDTGSTGYAESEPFAMTFTNVPEPASMLLVMGGGLALLRRRG